MARRYLSKHILEDQQQFIQLLESYEIDIFNINDIEKRIEQEFGNLNEILENLVDKKFLCRIERGKYARASFRDEKVIGCFIVPDGAIAYWTALNLHGLTEQFPNTVFIQTTHIKKGKSVFGVNYQFVKIKNTKRTGIMTRGFGNHEYRLTNKEKTLVDCFDLPQYSGGYPELIRAFAQANIEQDKLIDYCKAIGNISVVKRLAFLTEILEKSKMKRFLKYAEKEVNPRYVLIDPLGEQEGAFHNKWKLRLNISEEEILEICNKQY